MLSKYTIKFTYMSKGELHYGTITLNDNNEEDAKSRAIKMKKPNNIHILKIIKHKIK